MQEPDDEHDLVLDLDRDTELDRAPEREPEDSLLDEQDERAAAAKALAGRPDDALQITDEVDRRNGRKARRRLPKLSQADEAALCRRAAAGDKGARAECVARCGPMIRALASGFYSKNGMVDRDDFIATGREACLVGKVWRNYDPSVALFRTYARKPVRQAMGGLVRRHLQGPEVERAYDDERDANGLEDLDLALDLLDSMPQREASVWLLRAEGLTLGQIGKYLGWSTRTVRRVWSDVRQRGAAKARSLIDGLPDPRMRAVAIEIQGGEPANPPSTPEERERCRAAQRALYAASESNRVPAANTRTTGPIRRRRPSA